LLSVVVARVAGDRLRVLAEVVDLRKRGFTPVGAALQGAGIIHHMRLEVELAAETLTIERVVERQPVVAFEAGAATLGESCRDVCGRLATLSGAALDQALGDRLRAAIGGPLGCSHILTLAQFVFATVADVAPDVPAATGGSVRRDLVFDGSEQADGGLGIGVQLSDLHGQPAAANAAPSARFAAHRELRLHLVLHGWPATMARLAGAERRRRREGFSAAPWRDLGALLAPLQDLSLGKGANRTFAARLAGHPALRDALLMLTPALIQCRASFPDKWLNVATTAAGHPGLIGMADSCYMWRRGGALERLRTVG
jgi:hypothetical protein